MDGMETEPTPPPSPEFAVPAAPDNAAPHRHIVCFRCYPPLWWRWRGKTLYALCGERLLGVRASRRFQWCAPCRSTVKAAVQHGVRYPRCGH